MKLSVNCIVAVAAFSGFAVASQQHSAGLRALQTCGAIGDRTQQCGATNTDRPLECCEVRKGKKSMSAMTFSIHCDLGQPIARFSEGVSVVILLV